MTLYTHEEFMKMIEDKKKPKKIKKEKKKNDRNKRNN